MSTVRLRPVGDAETDGGGQPSVGQAFGQVLRTLRHERGLSQEALAEAANLHVTHVSRLENGHKGPTLAAVFALARALDVPVVDLVARVDGLAPKLTARRGMHSDGS